MYAGRVSPNVREQTRIKTEPCVERAAGEHINPVALLGESGCEFCSHRRHGHLKGWKRIADEQDASTKLDGVPSVRHQYPKLHQADRRRLAICPSVNNVARGLKVNATTSAVRSISFLRRQSLRGGTPDPFARSAADSAEVSASPLDRRSYH
jgi:hypothetical protein